MIGEKVETWHKREKELLGLVQCRKNAKMRMKADGH